VVGRRIMHNMRIIPRHIIMEHTQLIPAIMVDIRIIRPTIAMAIQLTDGIRERDILGRAPTWILRHRYTPIRGQIPIGYPMRDGVDRVCSRHAR